MANNINPTVLAVTVLIHFGGGSLDDSCGIVVFSMRHVA